MQLLTSGIRKFLELFEVVLPRYTVGRRVTPASHVTNSLRTCFAELGSPPSPLDSYHMWDRGAGILSGLGGY